MTVQELIEKLQKIENKDRLVLVALDEEGNEYHTPDDFEEMHSVLFESGYETRMESLTDHQRSMGYDDDDLFEAKDNPRPTLVLWP